MLRWSLLDLLLNIIPCGYLFGQGLMVILQSLYKQSCYTLVLGDVQDIIFEEGLAWGSLGGMFRYEPWHK